MMPIITPKYDIGFVVKNCSYEMLYELEPWCSSFYGEFPKHLIEMFTRSEQPNTMTNLSEKIHSINYGADNDIVVKFDGSKLNNQNFQLITQFSQIFANNQLEIGEFELDIFKIQINKLKTYERELIKNENTLFNSN